MILPAGSTAYEVIKRQKPDLILLDVGVAPEDSWVLFQILRLDEETISIPVLIASSDPTRFEKTALGLDTDSIQEYKRLRGRASLTATDSPSQSNGLRITPLRR